MEPRRGGIRCPAFGEGYVAGTVLAAGVRSAGTLDQERLRVALAELELTTVFGPYRVSPENGAQIGAQPLVVQIRLGKPQRISARQLILARAFVDVGACDTIRRHADARQQIPPAHGR